ncbi:hypothetical protein [Hymenobacter rigui]|uniref:Fibronectin type III domain-containing protein n=1 Tax=Hymenobacter rigui TaxID=334424 RepID=A0A428KX98_9BACT|nr:hypothetical protein [Hymenobacter rigui]RSK51329.1 hypothetical protein EI291_03185 [Hymenobacter rigui]
MPRTFILLAACLLVSLLAYGATVTLFRAQMQGDSVHLEWNAANEQGISGYEVYRQDYPADDFDKITSLTPTAQPHYRYIDQNVFRQEMGREGVTYRLAVRTATGTRTYQTTPAQPEANVVLRSWDTIKLMFR